MSVLPARFYEPRADMPQVDLCYYPRLIADAMGKGKCGITFDTVRPHTLHRHQRVDHNKALAMPEATRIKPILVSADGYVLDGNHRLFANEQAHAQWINVIRLGIPFERAITWLKLRPYVYEITPATPERT